MGQTIIGETQNLWNEMGNKVTGISISKAKELSEKFDKAMSLKVELDSKVTIYDEFVDPTALTRYIQDAIENNDRTTARQEPQHHVVQRNPNLVIGRDYTIGDMQEYANNKGREINYDNDIEQQNEQAIEESHIAKTTEQQNDYDNYSVRSAEQVREDEFTK